MSSASGTKRPSVRSPWDEVRLRAAVVVLVMAWPVLLGWTLLARVAGQGGVVTAAVEVAAAGLCHQKPDRSFSTAGVTWPVCGRCAGLYLAAPVGVLVARRRSRRAWSARRTLGWAALPTVLTLALEWFGLAPVTNLVRAAAAAPLAVAVVAVILGQLDDRRATFK